MDFSLVPEASTTYTVSGFVVEDGVASGSTAGTPVSGATVLVTDGPYANKSATTGSDGSYQLAGVSGAMNVNATKAGYISQTKSVTVTADSTLHFAIGVEVVTYTLSGFVTEDGAATGSTAGAPVSGVTVRITDGPHANKQATVVTRSLA